MRKLSTSSVVFPLIVYFLLLPKNADGKRYNLFSCNKTDYAIVVSKTASDSEKDVAKELQEYLKMISGAVFPIRQQGTSGKRIVIGYNDIVSDLAPERRTFEPLDESFSIFNVKGDIIIYGGSVRGTMYGVYDFLRKEFSCEWYTKDVCKVPRKQKWSFRSIDREVHPAFKIRTVYFRSILDKQWVNHSHNSGQQTYWGCHTMDDLVPADKYYSSHPEYFGLWEGKRKADGQLCLSNPALVNICADAIKKVIIDNPDYLVYDLSQNDNQFPCQCKRCQSIVQEEGSEAGPIIRFVNQVADLVKEEYPDKYIGTFAYTYSRKAPRLVKPHDNVVVRICDGECCFSHSLENCEVNQGFLSDLESWSKITSNLVVWDYVTQVNEYLLPFPNYSVLQPNIKLFKRNGAIGVFEEGSYRSWFSDLSDLKTFLLTKLLWDDSVDVNALTDDFLNNVYGKAAPYVKQYIDYMSARVTDDMHISKNYYREKPYYTKEMIDYCRLLFSKAEAASENDEIRNRVKCLRIPVDYLYIRKFPKKAKKDGSYARFKQITEEMKINWVNRKTRMSDMLEAL